MVHVEVILGVSAFDKKDLTPKFLLAHNDRYGYWLPCAIMGMETTKDVAKRLLKSALGIESPVNFQHVGVADNLNRVAPTFEGRVLSVVYGVLLPELVKPSGYGDFYEWYGITELAKRRPLYEDHWDILMHVARKLAK